MKILFAVMGAEKLIQNGMHDLIRNTWAKEAEKYGDFRFFVGRGETVLHEDTVRVDAPDDKDNLIYKVVEMCDWALEHKYDRMVKVDIDTFVNVEELMTLPLTTDWIGTPLGNLGEMYGDTGAWSFIQGSCMILSARAMQLIEWEVIDTMELMRPELMKANGIISPYPHSEDLWIGQVLRDRVKSIGHRGFSNGPFSYHFAICHSTCTQEEWDARLRKWFEELSKGNFAYHESR